MSATFNTDLFANYFSLKSISEIENFEVYEGVEELYRKEEEARQNKLKKEWGSAKPGDWDKLVKKSPTQASNESMEDL